MVCSFVEGVAFAGTSAASRQKWLLLVFIARMSPGLARARVGSSFLLTSVNPDGRSFQKPRPVTALTAQVAKMPHHDHGPWLGNANTLAAWIFFQASPVGAVASFFSSANGLGASPNQPLTFY